jgi:hypothetical protein
MRVRTTCDEQLLRFAIVVHLDCVLIQSCYFTSKLAVVGVMATLELAHA